MATTTFLGNATINITPTGGTAYDVTDNCRSCSVSVGYEYLRAPPSAIQADVPSRAFKLCPLRWSCSFHTAQAKLRPLWQQSRPLAAAEWLSRHQARQSLHQTQSSF
jgi:hypothetical protein